MSSKSSDSPLKLARELGLLAGTLGADVPPELVEDEEDAADSLDPGCEVPLWHGGEMGEWSEAPGQRDYKFKYNCNVFEGKLRKNESERERT